MVYTTTPNLNELSSEVQLASVLNSYTSSIEHEDSPLCSSIQHEVSNKGSSSEDTTKLTRKLSELTREERAIQYAMLKFQEMDERQKQKSRKRRHSWNRKPKEVLRNKFEVSCCNNIDINNQIYIQVNLSGKHCYHTRVLFLS